jgi:hypothetical protein
MYRKILSAVLVLFSISMNSFAVDLEGDVATADGTPICAMVLASGKSMFSCSPSGPFSLKDLPLESDGAIKLQVYADGFLPFAVRTTDFGYQSVVMKRAGSCPVDDGLSGGKLDGTYRLIRATIHFNDDTIVDTAGPAFDATGTMLLSGNTFNVELFGTFDGQTTDFSQNGTYEDLGYFLKWRTNGEPIGQYDNVVIIEKGAKLIIEFNNTASGDDFSEITQWEKVAGAASASSSAQSRTVFIQENASSSNFSGIGVGHMIQSSGIKAFLVD